jgi:hypothetical protein
MRRPGMARGTGNGAVIPSWTCITRVQELERSSTPTVPPRSSNLLSSYVPNVESSTRGTTFRTADAGISVDLHHFPE